MTSRENVRRDSWGQVYREYQEHEGPVDSGTLFVQYEYLDGASGGVAKYVRLGHAHYPSVTFGREVYYSCGTAGSTNDIMSRLYNINNGWGNTYTVEAYLGAGQIVTEDHTVKLDYDYRGPNSELPPNTFAGLDRFGRVVDQVWLNWDNIPYDRYTYVYDRAGNRTARDNELSAVLDEDYTYDNLDRLVEWHLNNVSQQTWSLDSLGNDLSAGTYNAANEEDPTVGSSGYDAAGNMTTLKSADTATYDAWDRLARVLSGETILQYNQYDGTNRRIRIYTDFTGSTPGMTQDDYLRGQQVVETRENGATKYHTLWSPRYIDSPIYRDTLANDVVDANARIIYVSDANYNVTGLLTWNPNTYVWSITERYTYAPYGVVTYRLGNWTTTGSSANLNSILYTGRTLDLAIHLYYYRARFYDQLLERFISRDPIGYSGGINLYGYCGESPLKRRDAFGLDPESYPLTYWQGTADEHVSYHVADVTVSLTGSDLCNAQKDGKLLLKVVLTKAAGFDSTSDGAKFCTMTSYGYFILGTDRLKWDPDPEEVHEDQVSTHSEETRPKCPAKKQSGKYDLWLHADMDVGKTHIYQHYEITWSYECEVTKEKPSGNEKDPLKVKVVLVKDDPGGNIPDPRKTGNKE